MNTKTFYTKEFFYYSVPVMLVDLAIHLGIFEWMLTWFRFTVQEDYVLTRPRSLYFLVVGFIIAMVLVPVRLHERGYNWKKQILRVFYQCLITLGVFAASVNILFYSFAGHFFLYEGIFSVAAISIWHLVFRAAIISLIINLLRLSARTCLQYRSTSDTIKCISFIAASIRPSRPIPSTA